MKQTNFPLPFDKSDLNFQKVYRPTHSQSSGHIRIQWETHIRTALNFIFNTPRNLPNTKKRQSNCKITFNISKLLVEIYFVNLPTQELQKITSVASMDQNLPIEQTHSQPACTTLIFNKRCNERRSDTLKSTAVKSFSPGLCPGPSWGSGSLSPDPVSAGEGDTPFQFPRRLRRLGFDVRHVPPWNSFGPCLLYWRRCYPASSHCQSAATSHEPVNFILIYL